jgi:hypothetical protein
MSAPIRGPGPPGKRKSRPGRGGSLENIGNGNGQTLQQTGVGAQPENRAAEIVAELVWQCEDAVREHYFDEIYPREIRERTRRILRLAEWLDEQARTDSLAGLDELSCLFLPPFERAAEEHAAMLRRLAAWARNRGGR